MACGLRCGSADTRLLGLRVRIASRARMPVSCECRVLSGRGLSIGLITRPEESYRVCLWSRSLAKEEALAHWGGGLLSSHGVKNSWRWPFPAEICKTISYTHTWQYAIHPAGHLYFALDSQEWFATSSYQWYTQEGWGGGGGCRDASSPKNWNFKNTNFVCTMVLYLYDI